MKQYTLLPKRASDSVSVAFTPKGGCPLKLAHAPQVPCHDDSVAFTPKGGCPLKRSDPLSVGMHSTQ